jgi:hypothetical protein
MEGFGLNLQIFNSVAYLDCSWNSQIFFYLHFLISCYNKILNVTDCCFDKFNSNQSMCNTNDLKLMTINSLSTTYQLNNLVDTFVCGYGSITLTTSGLIGM